MPKPTARSIASLPYQPPRTMSEIRANNKACGGHWFDRDTLSFFKSRIGTSFLAPDGSVYFVTSEEGPAGGRRYSVRRAKSHGCEIETVGEFQAHGSSAAARAAARRAAGR